jgi:hypothetical protein
MAEVAETRPDQFGELLRQLVQRSLVLSKPPQRNHVEHADDAQRPREGNARITAGLTARIGNHLGDGLGRTLSEVQALITTATGRLTSDEKKQFSMSRKHIERDSDKSHQSRPSGRQVYLGSPSPQQAVGKPLGKRRGDIAAIPDTGIHDRFGDSGGNCDRFDRSSRTVPLDHTFCHVEQLVAADDRRAARWSPTRSARGCGHAHSLAQRFALDH